MVETNSPWRFSRPDPRQIALLLRELAYPATKGQLIEHARERRAYPDVLSVLERIPDRLYRDMVDLETTIESVEEAGSETTAG